MIKGGTLVRSSFCLFLFFCISFSLYSFISSFFSIVTFLGWTQLQATWIKPEVVATKKYTGCLHYRFITTWSRFLWSPCCSYMWVFFSSCVALPIVCPSMISCFRCSGPFFGDKRFGFWPHITHVIVLTFKEIKHLSDYRTVGLSDYRSDPVGTVTNYNRKIPHCRNSYKFQ
jgi:hypothetical protein